MAKLSYRARKNLPDSAFALPGKRKLPLTNARGNLDRGHVGNAASRLSAMHRRGTISHADYARARRAIFRAERTLGMHNRSGSMHSTLDNPVGDFVTEHPWLTFFLGLAAVNTVGWVAILAIAATQKGPPSGAPAFSQASVIPIPVGSSPTVKVGDSLQLVYSGVSVSATTGNSAVIAPASGVDGGFVAIAPGSAVLTANDGRTTTVQVVLTGTAGVGKAAPKAMPTIIPRLLKVA